LGKDTFLLCLQKLDNASLCACALVCKQYSILAKCDLVW
jgi:F-box domain